MRVTQPTENKPLGEENHHYWRVVAMAKAAGLDLQEALEDGRLSQEEWAGLVQKCRGCDWEREGGCGRWLNLALAKEAPSETPSTCVNHDRFEALSGKD